MLPRSRRSVGNNNKGSMKRLESAEEPNGTEPNRAGGGRSWGNAPSIVTMSTLSKFSNLPGATKREGRRKARMNRRDAKRNQGMRERSLIFGACAPEDGAILGLVQNAEYAGAAADNVQGPRIRTAAKFLCRIRIQCWILFPYGVPPKYSPSVSLSVYPSNLDLPKNAEPYVIARKKKPRLTDDSMCQENDGCRSLIRANTSIVCRSICFW